MKNLFYALTFFSFVTACSDNSVQNPTPPPVSDNGDNNNMQVVEFLRNRAMVASYNTIFPNKETERIERKRRTTQLEMAFHRSGRYWF